MFRKWPLWLYSLGNLAGSLAYTTVNTYIIFFYTDIVHISARLIGQIWFIFGIWNTVNDLLLGWLSDRVPARLGRRLFLMLVFAVPVGIAYFFLWNPPLGLRQYGDLALALYFLVLVSLYDSFQTAVAVSQGAVFPELATVAHDRAKLSAFRQTLGIVGVALAFVVSPIIYGQLGWQALGAIWGGLIALLYLLSAIGVRHQVTLQHQLQPTTRSWWQNLRSIFLNRPFVLLMLLNFVIRFSISCLQIGMPFYARYTLGISATTLAIGLSGILAAAALAIPFWPLVIRRLGPRATAIIVMIVMIALLVPLLFTTHLGAVLPLAILLGPAYSGTAIILDLLYAQVVDLDLLKAGQSRAGMIGGILGTMLRFSPAVAGLVIGELLTISNYNPILTVQPELTQLTLRLIMTLLPIVTLMIGIVLVYFYPIHGRVQRELETKIAGVYA